MKNKIILIFRVFIGLSFILSGLTKMLELNDFITVVYKFNVLPQDLVIPFASILPPLELVFGITLFIGYLTRFSSFMIMCMLLSMLVAIFPQLLGGPEIGDCGCFSGLLDSSVDINLFVRDVILFAIVYCIFIQSKHNLAFDNKGNAHMDVQ